MIINTQEVESLIKSKVPALQISEETGLSTKGITNYRTDKAKLGNMTRGYLEKLQQFYNVHKEDTPTEKIKIKGIRKTVRTFNDWHGAAQVYFNQSDMSVWTNVYDGPGEEDRYDDPTITKIAQKATTRIDERDDRITMRKIREAVNAVLTGGK